MLGIRQLHDAQKHKGHLAVAFVFLGCLVEVAGITRIEFLYY